VILSLHAPTAVGQYRVDVWTTEQGLPQNIVRAVHMGRDGYLWLTTLDGLVRFDGLRFTSFDRSNTKGIASNRFSPLLETSDGALWLGTENGDHSLLPGTVHDLHHAGWAPVERRIRHHRR
jgi:ligand-binding sensor domain-containing protein